MELFLRICTWRNWVLAAAAGAMFFAAGRLQKYPRRWLAERRYPPQRGTVPGGDEIVRLEEKRESDQLRRRGERVLALLTQAEAEGFDVSALRRKTAAALQLDDARYRRQAVRMLAEVELAVPRRKARDLPLYPAGEEDDVPADVPGRRAVQVRR